MRSPKALIIVLAIALSAPAVVVQARGSTSPSDPAVGALMAAYMREKYCGKKMTQSGLLELINDAFPAGADTSRMGEFVKEMKARGNQAYKMMPKGSRQKSVLCPRLEEELAKWLVDKLKHPERYR